MKLNKTSQTFYKNHKSVQTIGPIGQVIYAKLFVYPFFVKNTHFYWIYLPRSCDSDDLFLLHQQRERYSNHSVLEKLHYICFYISTNFEI